MNTIFTFLTAGAMLAGLLQVPAKPVEELALQASNSILKEISSGAVAQVSASGVVSDYNLALSLTDTFFGEESKSSETKDTIAKKMEFVSTREAYPASLKVIQKHNVTIKSKARQYGVPEDVALGVGLLENGGSETAKSPAGALGVFQLMPGTARSLGLTVSKNVDERRNPEKNIDAGMRYLKANYDRFGDWGLSTWAYHAGEGNVTKALKLHAKANHGISLVGLKDAQAMRSYVDKYDITIHKLLSDPSVKTMTRKLKDDSSGYPYKVVATASLFRQAELRENIVAR